LKYGAHVGDNTVAAEHAKLRDDLERAVKSDPEHADAWAFLSLI
jgi:hypothetical protein